MAGGGLLMLLDDITALLDDIAVMSKVAARNSTAAVDDVATMTKVAMQKTAGVLGDDLALNAEKVTGVNANRELPVVWAVAKGSLWNKFILVPAALLISAFAPWLIKPLLMIGGAFLCFEGVEKILSLFHKPGKQDASEITAEFVEAEKKGVAPSSVRATKDAPQSAADYEKDKVKGAIRTDFILSAEIMAIALGTVSDKPIWEQGLVLVSVALAITVFVYGLVAGIVRMDDVGEWLKAKSSAVARAIGSGLIASTPWLMRGLSIVGTAAMFLVGGSLLVHGIPFIEHWLHDVVTNAGTLVATVLPLLVHAGVGAVIGAIVVLGVHVWGAIRGKPAH